MALKLAVRAADAGYDNVEEEIRQRFWAIHAQLDQEHQQAEAHKKTQKSGPGQKTNESNQGGGY